MWHQITWSALADVLQTFMGVLLGSAVVPIALCVTWKKASKMGCIVGAVFGLVCGIIAWLVTTAKLNPGIDVVVCSIPASIYIYRLTTITDFWR
jgi:Na+/proline symporter